MSLPLAITYYDSKAEDEATSQIAWSACLTFLPCSVLLMMIFLVNIKSEYRTTFWSAKKSKDFILGYFESDEDETKAFVFISNIRYWKEIEDKVEEWVRENWAKWMEEEPEWLNDNIKALIPPKMIPNVDDREKVKFLKSERRRSSVFGSIVLGRRKSTFIRPKKVAPAEEKKCVM